MALLEGFRVQNYRALRDVTLGKVYRGDSATPLTPLTAVIGKNGVGKSTLFDAFGFLADCLNHDVETACHMRQRGGFERLRSRGSSGPISFTVRYIEAPDAAPIEYLLKIDRDANNRAFVSHELLFREAVSSNDRELVFLEVAEGKGLAITTEETAETPEYHFELNDSRQLSIAVLGVLKGHSRIRPFRDFLKGWYLSYFGPDAAREKPMSGPQSHLNERGDNLGNVVQFMLREHKDRFRSILAKIASKIPGIASIDVKETEDNRLLLRFNDGAFSDPFLADQMSDGTLKLFTYLLLLEDPDPPPLICIEEPENGLYHKLLEALAIELRAHATGEQTTSQVIVTTHNPYLIDALSPAEVWILEKGKDGFSTISRASDIALVRNLFGEGMPLGGLWYSDYLDAR
jgi:predicted ATPase